MKRRTALTTTASILGVIVAGTTAVGANLGILTAANSTGVGELSVISEAPKDDVPSVGDALTNLGPEVVDIYLDDIIPPVSTPPALGATIDPAPLTLEFLNHSSTYESFEVDLAGSVVIENYGTSIELEDISTNAGWEFSSSVRSSNEISVTFVGPTTLVFTAELLADGTIAARVEEPVIVEIPVPTSTVPRPHDDDDDHEGRDDDDDHHDDDDDDHHDDDDDDDDEHHEGRDDDD